MRFLKDLDSSQLIIDAGKGGRLLWVLLVVVLAGCRGAGQTDVSLDVDREAYRSWEAYLGDRASTQYSALDQIHVDNVHELEVAWTFETDDAIPDRTQIQCNPIVIDDRLYGTTAQLKAFALEADSGERLWTFDPFEGEAPENHGVNRGVAYWSADGDRRIFYVADTYLYALDADTGRPIETFGEEGRVDLREGLGRDPSGLFVSATSPGVVYGDLLIQGTRVSETEGAAPGHIRAYNVRTGEIAWTFHTIPQPGEYGYETWPPDAWTRVGGANNWSGMSLDEERGIVFIPTGSAAFDFYGGDRIGRNLFANTLLALDAATGERVWHYQIVRHDLWDRDLPAPPNLITIERDGRRVDAVAQVTKSGHVFVFERETGEPLFPIEEVEAPPSDLVGEEAWPTQPLPVEPEPFARQAFTEDMITERTPEAHEAVRERFQEVRSDGQFVPPSLEGTMIFPGFDGGAEWGGAAFDPETGRLYVNSNEMPWILTMEEVVEDGDEPFSPGQRVYATNCAGCHGANRTGDVQQSYPSLLDLDARFERDDVTRIIREGQGVMPAFPQLDQEEVDALVAFLMEEEDAAPVAQTSEDDEDEYQLPYAHTGWNRFLDPDGYPAVEPPWGALNALDLNTGDYDWQVRFGEFEELTEQGIPQTGTENYGGPVVTAGGLLFIAATQDEKFRAYDKTTGEVLWETDLPAGGYATPATYEVDGRQYVVIAAGGGKMGTPSGDTYVAFALPE